MLSCHDGLQQCDRLSSSVTNLAQVTISNDNVFGDNTSAQIAQMAPSMSGSVSAGYTATATIGLAV
jgi:hypothetical protein